MKAPGHRFALGFFGSVVVFWLLAMFAVMRASVLAPEAAGPMLVVFEPGTSKEQAFAAITRAGGSPIRETEFGFIWVVQGAESGLAGRLAAEGALGSYRELPINPNIAGCVAIADAKVANVFGLQ